MLQLFRAKKKPKFELNVGSSMLRVINNEVYFYHWLTGDAKKKYRLP